MSCPYCTAPASLVSKSYTQTFSIRGGKPFEVDGIEYFICAACGNEHVSPEQAQRNDERINKAKPS